MKSSALRLGSAAPRAVTAFYALSLAFALLAGWSGGLGLVFTAVAAAPGLHLAWQAIRVDVADPKRALALFKANTLTGLLLFAAIVVGGARL